jgi:hypothetical protein
MTTAERPRVRDIVRQYGDCLELVPMDPHFHNISVGLYIRDDIATVWTFSTRPGADERVQQIAGRLVALGGMEATGDRPGQVRFPCGHLHQRALRFLLTAAVAKDPDSRPPEELSIRDSKSPLTVHLAGEDDGERYVYHVSVSGDFRRPEIRQRAVVAGFVRYGEMVKIADDAVAFPCGRRHDELAGLILPHSRNISAVEDALEAGALRGQMTTSTLGFSSSP